MNRKNHPLRMIHEPLCRLQDMEFVIDLSSNLLLEFGNLSQVMTHLLPKSESLSLILCLLHHHKQHDPSSKGSSCRTPLFCLEESTHFLCLCPLSKEDKGTQLESKAGERQLLDKELMARNGIIERDRRLKVSLTLTQSSLQSRLINVVRIRVSQLLNEPIHEIAVW